MDRDRELRCLYRILSWMNEQDMDVDELLQRAAAALPRAYEHPGSACARIRIGDRVFQSEGFRETDWAQSAPVGTFTRTYGTLQACYRESHPERDEGPFREGERELIDTLGGLLGDFIERKETEERLRVHEERLRKILQSVPISLWAVDSEGNVTLSEGRVLHGLVPPEGGRIDLAVTDSDQSALAPDLRRALGGREVRSEILWGGATLESRCFPTCGPDAAIDGVFCIATDVTDRMRAEADLREKNSLLEEIFAGSSFLIARMDTDLRFLHVNEAFAKACGSDVARFPGRNFHDMIPCGSLAAILRRVADTGVRFSEQDADVPGFGQPAEGAMYCDVECFRAREGTSGGIVLILVDRTKRVLALRDLQRSRRDFRSLAAHLQDLREEERKTIAREIHDELGGQLTALKMDIALAHGVSRPETGMDGDALGAAEEAVNRAIVLVQRIASGLRPKILDDFGLESAIEWLVSDFRRRAQIRCDLACRIGDAPIGKAQATALFRILQEGLTNVARHAHATRVSVAVRASGGAAEMEVSDNGIGIPESKLADADSFGLIGIHERAERFGGSVRIGPLPHRGTRISVSIPLDAKEEAHDPGHDLRRPPDLPRRPQEDPPADG